MVLCWRGTAARYLAAVRGLSERGLSRILIRAGKQASGVISIGAVRRSLTSSNHFALSGGNV